VTGELTIPILGKTQAQALVKAQNFQRAVAHRLDFPIIFTQEVSLPPAFGSNIKESLLIAAGVALLLALALLYFAFSRVRVALVIIAFMFVDAVLTLAGISVLSLPLGLSTVSGLLFVVLSGLSQHVIITNELLKGVQTQEKVSIGWRSSRALSISYLASLTVILISISIALLGFGSIRVFAITTAAGMIIAVLLTRPVFARMMESVLSWTPQRTPPESAKPEQKQQ
jgi:preprotein translocase subunit SecD